MACEARHAPTGPSGRTCALRARTARPCVLVGTSQTCRGCREGALCAPENGEQKTENRTRGKRDRQTTVRESLQARPSDVPGVQGELLPAGAWGSAPHPPIPTPFHSTQSACASTPKICPNLRDLRFPPFVSFVSFVISNHSGSSLCTFVVLRVLCDSRAA